MELKTKNHQREINNSRNNKYSNSNKEIKKRGKKKQNPRLSLPLQ
jgi:hypothetical protein